MNINPEKILVVRNDKLGDFMLTWPALATLKQSLPSCEIHALVNPYTADIARLCPDIDRVIPDIGADAALDSQLAFAKQLKQSGYDAALTLFSTTRVGWLLLLAGIPYRLAPATKIAQLFYHRRLKQRRSRSEQPEHAYNRDLVVHYLHESGITNIAEPEPPYLHFESTETQQLRQEFCAAYQIPAAQKLVFIHPGSGGSANNLMPEQYALLGRQLTSKGGHHIVVSAGPGELEQATGVADSLCDTPHSIYHSTEGLVRFARHIACADVFISGSTGPLHIAGALNCNTAAFYTRRRSATALRWQTVNSKDKRLAFSPPQGADAEDMSSIDVSAAAMRVSERFLHS
ncbi:hypothetical protein Tel_02870 [Candidatus Tenderia electrophaga]|uniref:ADP-heptose--LPS heptosyltransferase n=1 Tax=Candidatus Tenderia electrophaga TaxID=1748243 RepID=A0A0S2THS2_9GAMM|nr:hypothetical protein Tel_02870 [Candidatus Tenderia electrophaga]